MRNYQLLDSATVEKDNVLWLSTTENNPDHPLLAMSREGAFVSISASFGPLEVALRLQYNEFSRQLVSLHPVPGLATTRQVGTVNSYIALGLTKDNRLVMRPTIVTDARGHVTFNLVISEKAFQSLLQWLEVEK
jgi:hypothetical protein